MKVSELENKVSIAFGGHWMRCLRCGTARKETYIVTSDDIRSFAQSHIKCKEVQTNMANKLEMAISRIHQVLIAERDLESAHSRLKHAVKGLNKEELKEYTDKTAKLVLKFRRDKDDENSTTSTNSK